MCDTHAAGTRGFILQQYYNSSSARLVESLISCSVSNRICRYTPSIVPHSMLNLLYMFYILPSVIHRRLHRILLRPISPLYLTFSMSHVFTACSSCSIHAPPPSPRSIPPPIVYRFISHRLLHRLIAPPISWPGSPGYRETGSVLEDVGRASRDEG